MHALPDLVERVAARMPLPALPLGLVVDLVGRERPGPPPDPETLRRAVERRSARLRILEAWPAPAPGRARSRRTAGPPSPGGTWILFLGPADGAEDLAPAVRVLRWSVVALGRSAESESRRSRARWIRLARECDRLSRTLLRHPEALYGAEPVW